MRKRVGKARRSTLHNCRCRGAQQAARGVETAWLACAVGNHRAARFYEKSGRRLAGTVVDPATPSGPFPPEVWRYEKRLICSM
jgi:hypothetical protein